MKPKNCLLFGASGQIGKNLIRKLTYNNYKVTAVTRNYHQKGVMLKTQGNAGYIEVREANIFDEKQLNDLISEADICINLVGILYEKGKLNTFKNIHSLFPEVISKICNKNKIENFIHISALGIEESSESKYSNSKLEGEKKILSNYPSATILRPSIVYSIDDNFTTSFMTLLSRLPFFPLYYNGKTKFMPIHSSDLVNIIYNIISKNIYSQIIECVGPETLTLQEIIEKLLNLIDKKRILLPMPLLFGKFSAKFFKLFTKPLLTEDQLRLLKYDNIVSGKYKTNTDIGFPAKCLFEKEVEKYCYMWRQGGQFSKKISISKN